MKKLLLLLFLGLTPLGYAVEIQQIPSPDNANAILIDRSGRRDVIELRSGVKVIRLFYDDIDSLKPYIAKAYGVPVAKIGKIVLPTFVSAKWLSATEVEIVCDSGVSFAANDSRDFDFTAVVSSMGAEEKVTITKKETPKKEKIAPSKKSPSKKGKRED
jgi:hypothetical protein